MPPKLSIWPKLCLLGLSILFGGACTPKAPSSDELAAAQNQVQTYREELEAQKRLNADTTSGQNQKLSELTAENQRIKAQLEDYKSQVTRLKEGRDALLKPPSKVEIRLLRSFDNTVGANIEYSVTNNSDMFIWQAWIGIDIFDSNNQFLGNELECLTNIRPGQSATGKASYSNVSSSSIGRWKPFIKRIMVNQPGGATSDKSSAFTLEDATK